jgi:hypothetical protein
MKPFGSFLKPLVLGMLAAAGAFLSSPEAQAEVNKAVVRAVRGEAAFSVDNGTTWRGAKVGQIYKPGTLIRTGDKAQVDLFLGDNGPVVRVTEKSQLGVDKLDIDRSGTEPVIETDLNLKNGRIMGNVKKLAAASKYEVETPKGVAAIRGTEYSIASDGQVTVISGIVVVTFVGVGGGQPQTVTLSAGQTASPPTAANTTAQVVATVSLPSAQAIIQQAADVSAVMVIYTQNPAPPPPPGSPTTNPNPEPPGAPPVDPGTSLPPPVAPPPVAPPDLPPPVTPPVVVTPPTAPPPTVPPPEPPPPSPVTGAAGGTGG